MSMISKDENLQLPLEMTVVIIEQHNNKIPTYFPFDL